LLTFSVISTKFKKCQYTDIHVILYEMFNICTHNVFQIDDVLGMSTPPGTSM